MTDSQREKAIQAIKNGYNAKGIRLASGNISNKEVRALIKETDPYMFSILCDTSELTIYRNKLWHSYCES
jgi:hypothetical protein